MSDTYLVAPGKIYVKDLIYRCSIDFPSPIVHTFPFLSHWPIVLVGGIPTPLKNDGVRQMGWWHSQLNGKIIQMVQTTNQLCIYIYYSILYWHILAHSIICLMVKSIMLSHLHRTARQEWHVPSKPWWLTGLCGVGALRHMGPIKSSMIFPPKPP